MFRRITSHSSETLRTIIWRAMHRPGAKEDQMTFLRRTFIEVRFHELLEQGWDVPDADFEAVFDAIEAFSTARISALMGDWG